MEQGIKEQKFFYGWVVAAISCLLLVVCFGVQYSFGIFFKPLISEFGWSRAETSGIFSLYMIARGVLSILMGFFYDRYGPRKTVSIGGISMGLGLLLTSKAKEIWQIYILYSIMGGLGAASFYVPLASTLSKWFIEKRGFVLGLYTSGVGIGAIIFSPLAEFLISSYNWRFSYIIISMITLSVTFIAVLFLRPSPGEMGFWPDGKKKSEVFKTSKHKVLNKGEVSLKIAIKSLPFWMIFVSEIVNYIITVTPLVHIAAFATDCGISTMVAASLLAIIGGFSIVGRLIIGGISDRIGPRNLLPITFIIMALMLFSLTLSKDPLVFYLFAIIFGFAYGGSVPLIPAITARYFGLSAMGSILGTIMFGGVIGGGIGPWLTGYIFDLTESYNIAFIAMSLIAMFGTFPFLFLKK